MKRLLLAVLLSLCAPAVWAAHFDCTLDAACTAAAPCDWNTAANWNDNGLCNAAAPANGGGHTYTATIPSGRVVNLATDGLTVGLASQNNPAITCEGVCTMSASSTGRDANAFRTLNLLPNAGGATLGTAIYLGSTGVFRVTAGNRLHFDTSSGNRARIDMANSAILDIQGTVTTTTLDQVGTIAANDTLCGGADSNLQYYVVTVKSGFSAAKLGRRIRFADGQLRNRQFEIVSLDGDVNDLCLSAPGVPGAACLGAGNPYPCCTGIGAGAACPGLPFACCTGAGTGTCTGTNQGAIGFCTELADGTSLTCGAGATCGQQLTGHSAVGQFPDATPSANSRHWTPTPTPNNTICTSAKVPEPYCTGDEAGTGFFIYPQAGDTIEIIDDAWLVQTAGTAGWQITASNMTTMPCLNAVNMSGGAISIGSTTTAADDVPCDFSYNNMHEYVAGSINIGGFQDYDIFANAIHDASSNVTAASGALSPTSFLFNTTPTPDNVQVRDNHIYRYFGNAINFQSAGNTVSATGARVLRNLVQHGGTGSVMEGGIEVNLCQSCEVGWNLVHDIVDGTGGANQGGNCYRAGGSSTIDEAEATVWHHNIGVNCGRHGMAFNSTVFGGEQITATHNYISNVFRSCYSSGRNYNNFCRNYDIAKNQNPGFMSPVSMYGNFLVSHDDAVESGFCSGACSGQAVYMGEPAGGLTANDPDITLSDNVFKLVSNAGTINMGVWVFNDYTGDSSIDHTTCDMNGNSSEGCINLSVSVPWAPTINTPMDIRDTAVLFGNDGQVGTCSTDAQADTTWGTYAGNRSSIAAEKLSNSTPITNSSSCISAGTRFDTGGAGLGYTDRVALDYQLVDGAPLATAGAFPSGSALGSRAWRFNWDALKAIWTFPFNLSAGDPTGETVTPVPKDFSNGTCSGLTECNQDTDGDGVMDLHDNCDGTWNPSQWDTDEDNKGDACDR